MLVSCHAALTTEKTEPAGQEQKLEKNPTKKQPLLIEHHDFNGLRFENKQRSQKRMYNSQNLDVSYCWMMNHVGCTTSITNAVM